MMRFTGLMLGLAMAGDLDVGRRISEAEISIFDAKSRSGYSWILVDDCPVEIKTADFKGNLDKIIETVNRTCHLGFESVNEKE